MENSSILNLIQGLYVEVVARFLRNSAILGKLFVKGEFNAGKEKSKTFKGIAKAMAEQWGKQLFDEAKEVEEDEPTAILQGMWQGLR